MRGSFHKFLEKTLVQYHPVHAARAVLEMLNALRRDVLSNVSRVVLRAVHDHEARAQVTIEIFLNSNTSHDFLCCCSVEYFYLPL